jgi:DHA1 family inner membrane transport protein
VHLRVIVLVYAALLVAEISWAGVTPLIPSYIEAYDLTDFEGGLVLSVASLGILVISIPAGLITKWVYPRTLTLAAMATIALAGYAMALAPDYWTIVAARLLFGLGFGIFYVAMTAWVADAAGHESARILALTSTIVGVAATVSPAYAGWVAENFGLNAPFVALAGIATLLLILLVLDRSPTGRNKEAGPPVRDLLRAAKADRSLSAMLLMTLAAALVWMTADLLVPIRLADGGFDAADIGVAFAITAVVFAVTSAATARRADRLARINVAAWWTAGLAVVTVVPALALGVPAILVFLIGLGVTTGVTGALTYPFGLLAVRRGAVTVAVMSSLVNIIWAVSGLLGPSVGGAFAEWAGDRLAFALLALGSAVTVVLLVRYCRPQRVAASGPS